MPRLNPGSREAEFQCYRAGGWGGRPAPPASKGRRIMTKTDIARRVYNHTWKLDPIVRSLLDTDFYKLLMLQMIWGLYPKVEATFSLINRTTSVRLADEIDEQRAARPARPCAHAALLQEGDDLAGRQHLLRPQADLRAGVPAPGWQNFRLPEYELEQARRPVRAELPRPVDVHHACGKSRRWPSSTSCARARR